MAATLKYDKETCGRCGGVGRYSYCLMYGDRCFGCAGKGTRITKAGAKAAAAIKAFMEANFSVAVEDLKPGDRIKVDGKLWVVGEVKTEGGGRYSAGKDAVTGETIWKDYVTVTPANKVKDAFMGGFVSGHGFIPGTKVLKAVGGADWDAVVAFARTIKKGVTVVDAVAVAS